MSVVTIFRVRDEVLLSNCLGWQALRAGRMPESGFDTNILLVHNLLAMKLETVRFS